MICLRKCPGCHELPVMCDIDKGAYYKCVNDKCKNIVQDNAKTKEIARQFWNLAVKLYKLRKINS